jgi:Bacterial Ig-like domain (group 2)
MSNCRRFVAFPPICMLLFLAGCGNPAGLDSVNVTPATQSAAVGQTTQFTAIGTYGNASHSSTQDVTSTVTWTSSTPAVATVSASGAATAVSAGSTVITANAMGYNGPISSSATLTVTGSAGGAGGGSGGSILSLTIIPSGIDFGSLGESGQFLAIGTFSTAPTVRDLTNSVTWHSSEPNSFPVNNNTVVGGQGTENGGVVSAFGSSNGPIGATITAEATDSNNSIATATATVGCPLVLPNPPTTPGSCYQVPPFPLPLLITLSVYNEGLNTTDWEVIAPSATATPTSPPVLTCGAGFGAGSVCAATYPYGFTVTLTAPANGARFGGWSSNCTKTAPVTETGPNTCTVTLTTDETVGAIFN